VMKLLLGDSRNSSAAATSSASPILHMHTHRAASRVAHW
jgi:hypothetical protein